MAILIGGIWHETNTFSSLATDLDSFRRFQLVEGDAIRETFAATNSELGGMLSPVPGGIRPPKRANTRASSRPVN